MATPAHIAAKTICLASWEEQSSAEGARAAFLQAAREAGILTDE
ncbi:DUF982 domain-containing protein [Kaistia terrae]